MKIHTGERSHADSF